MQKQYQVKISAGIVLYNSDFQEVCGCIDSFFINNGNYIILIDNNSKNNILIKLITHYKYNNKVFYLKLNDNKGFGFGHNAGFQYLKENNILGEFHIILNPDVLISSNCLDILKNYLDNNKNISMVVPKILNKDLTLQPLNKNHPNIFDMLIRRFLPEIITNLSMLKKRYNKYIRMDIGYDKICEVPFASGCFYFIRSDVFERINGFDDKFFLYMEDADLCRRIWKIGKIIYNPNAKIIHIWKRESHKNFKMTILMIKSMIYYFKKHGLCLF